MTEHAYPALTTAQTIFKTLVWDPAFVAGELALEGAVPALKLPLLDQLDHIVIQELSNYFFHQFVLFIDVAAIRLVNAEHQREFEKASSALHVIAVSQGIDSPEFEAARVAHQKALALFIRFPRA